MTSSNTIYSGGPGTTTQEEFVKFFVELLSFHGIETKDDYDASIESITKIAADKGDNNPTLIKITIETSHPLGSQHEG